MARDAQVVLIVEDDPLQRELAAELLGETKLTVVECDCAETALGYMQRRGGEVAMIFSDIQLPGLMDGVDLARAVAKLWPTVTLVVTSGAGGSRTRDLPRSAAFMPKPWRALDVLVAAERSMRQPPPAVA